MQMNLKIEFDGKGGKGKRFSTKQVVSYFALTTLWVDNKTGGLSWICGKAKHESGVEYERGFYPSDLDPESLKEMEKLAAEYPLPQY